MLENDNCDYVQADTMKKSILFIAVLFLLLRISLSPAFAVSFEAAMNFDVGSVPYSVTTGDFNGDGKIDLAVANYYSHDVSILLGNGDGTFQTAVNHGVGHFPKSVIAGEFNGDGKIDLATANLGSYSVSILLGNGDGSFKTAVSYGAGNRPDSLVAGDFNGDESTDLAVANFYDHNVLILRGNGNGTFSLKAGYGVGDFPSSITAGDFNGDGKIDLAAANYYSHDVSILLGNGDGFFQAAVNYGVGINPQSLTGGDFNGDGRTDLAVTNYDDNDVSILLGNGDGSFQTAVDNSAGNRPYSVTTGDFNGDGMTDLAVTNWSSDDVSILVGNGDGSFQTAVNYSVGKRPDSVVVEDFNGDGRSDLAVTNYDDNDVSILINTMQPLYAPLNVMKTGTGTGTIASNPQGVHCGAVCLYGYNFDTDVTLTATEDVGSIFKGWAGDCSDCGTNTNCNITMDIDKTCTATFNLLPPPISYTFILIKAGTGVGTVTSNPSGIVCGEDCSKEYSENAGLILTATPNRGSLFTGWTGDCSGCGTNTDCNIAMDRDKTCTARFDFALPPTPPSPDSYTLTVTKSGIGDGIVTSTPAGINCGTDCSGTYSKTVKPKNMKLRVRPDAYSTFLGWGGDCQGQGIKTTCTVRMDSDKHVTASFGVPDISVSPNSYDFGNVVVKNSSSSATFTIQNNGTGNLKTTKVKVIGTDAKMFKIRGGGKKTIVPGDTYSFTVTFKPTSTGTKSATLQILSNDPDTPTIEVPLSGTGNI